MIESLSFSPDDLYEEIVERVEEGGITDQEGWTETVEEVLEEHVNWGEMDIDDDLTSLKEALIARYTAYDKKRRGISDDGLE